MWLGITSSPGVRQSAPRALTMQTYSTMNYSRNVGARFAAATGTKSFHTAGARGRDCAHGTHLPPQDGGTLPRALLGHLRIRHGEADSRGRNRCAPTARYRAHTSADSPRQCDLRESTTVDAMTLGSGELPENVQC